MYLYEDKKKVLLGDYTMNKIRANKKKPENVGFLPYHFRRESLFKNADKKRYILQGYLLWPFLGILHNRLSEPARFGTAPVEIVMRQKIVGVNFSGSVSETLLHYAQYGC